MKNSILLLIFSMVFVTVYGQPGNNFRLNREPGKCYAKVLMPDVHEEEQLAFPVYIGNQPETVKLDTIEIILQEATSRWVKKKADRHCVSDNPADCLVWCLVDLPEHIETIVVVDTTTTKEFDFAYFSKKRITTKGGFTEWREVVCGNKIKKSFVKKLQEKLYDLDYEVDLNGKMNSNTKAALTNYQRDYNLPVGQLDNETLKSLNLSFPR